MTVEALTVIDRVAAAMQVASLRHAAIAQNIANRDARDYQRVKVQFDDVLGRGEPRLIVDPKAAAVSMEEDLLALATNAGRYSALASALGRYFGIAAAIAGPNGGR
jgi:flagellar basal body rod protein FlgB